MAHQNIADVYEKSFKILNILFVVNACMADVILWAYRYYICYIRFYVLWGKINVADNIICGVLLNYILSKTLCIPTPQINYVKNLFFAIFIFITDTWSV